MAVVKIKNIKSIQHLKAALDYNENHKKTVGGMLIEAINCDVENRYEDFLHVKKYYRKTKGRIAYQIIQSYAPGEVTPELAHKIGCEFVRTYLPNYQVTIATHIDKEHIHNHIIFNSVSFIDGKKFHITKQEFHEQLRGISNEINKKYGLSVIKPKQKKQRDYSAKEKKFKEDTGKIPISELIKKDIEITIKNSSSLSDFYIQMQNKGYDTETSGMYAKVKHPDAKKFFRLNTLGYSDEILISRITNKERFNILKKPQLYYSQKKLKSKQLTYFEAVYIKWLYKLGLMKKAQNSSSKVNFKEINKFEKYKKQLQFIAKYNITKMSELYAKEAELQTQKKALDVEKFKLSGAEKKYKEVFAAHAVYERLNPLQDINSAEQQKELKEAVVLIEKKGFSNFEAIDKIRNNFMQSLLKNKNDIRVCREALKEIESIREDLPKLKDEFEKEKKEYSIVKKQYHNIKNIKENIEYER